MRTLVVALHRSSDGGSCFSFPVSLLLSSAKKHAIFSRKAIPCDPVKANPALSLTSLVPMTTLSRVLGQSSLSAGLEKEAGQEVERNVEP